MQLNTFHFFFLSDFRSIYAFLFAVFLFCALFWCFCTLLREGDLDSGGLYGWIASPACPVLSKLSKLNDFTYDSFKLTSHLRGVYNRKNITRVFRLFRDRSVRLLTVFSFIFYGSGRQRWRILRASFARTVSKVRSSQIGHFDRVV